MSKSSTVFTALQMFGLRIPDLSSHLIRVSELCKELFGGGERSRTDDPLLAKQVL